MNGLVMQSQERESERQSHAKSHDCITQNWTVWNFLEEGISMFLPFHLRIKCTEIYMYYVVMSLPPALAKLGWKLSVLRKGLDLPVL